MQNPRRAEEMEGYDAAEQEERRTHGFHQELDRDRNGVPDYLEEEQESAYGDRDAWRKNDLNGNGIPDHLETDKPGGEAANDDCIPYGQEMHRNSSLDSRTRHSAGVFAATSDTAEPASDINRRVAQASAAASQEIRKDESNPKKGEFGKADIGKRVDKLRKQRLPKSTMLGDLSRLPAQKGDPDSSTEVIKAFWKGIVQAHLSTKQDEKAKKDAKIDQELRQLEKNERELDRAEREQARADKDSKDTALGKDVDPKEIASDSPTQEKPEKAASPTKAAEPATALDKAKAFFTKPKAAEASLEQVPEVASAAPERAASIREEMAPAPKVAQPAANDRLMKAQQGLKSLGLAPSPGQDVSRERALEGVGSAAKPMSPMMEQARGLKAPEVAVAAKGPVNPAPRTRAMGLGSGIGLFTAAARQENSQGTSLDIQHAAQKARDSGGMGR